MVECNYCLNTAPTKERAIIEGWIPPPERLDTVGPVCPKCIDRLFVWNEETEEWEKKGN